MISNIILIILFLTWLKSVFLGSDFSFLNYIKYGIHYLDWYRSRPDYIPPEDEIKPVILTTEEEE